MKEGWNISPLKDICEQMNGIWKGVKEPFVKAKILRTTNFSKDCQMKLDDLAIIDVEKKKMDARRLQRGDIVVEKSGGGPKQPVGRVLLFNIDDSDFSFCNFTSALRIKDRTKVSPEYLHKYLSYLYFNGETEKYQSNLVGFRNLDFKGYVSMEIQYPSISEQQRIVDILDKEFEKIDRLKSNAELNLRHAKDLFQAALKKELEPKEGWLNYRIDEICKVSPSKSEVKKKKLKENDIVSFLPMEDMTIGIKDVIPSIIKPFGEVSSSYTYFEDDDVLLAKVTPCFENGKLGIARELKNGVGYGSSEFIVFRVVKEKVLPDFIYYCLQEPFFKQEGKRRMIGACGLKRLPKDYVKEIVLGVPSIHQQHLIVSTLDNLSSKCKVLQDNYNKTLSLCDDLKQSLLRKAFNGEL